MLIIYVRPTVMSQGTYHRQMAAPALKSLRSCCSVVTCNVRLLVLGEDGRVLKKIDVLYCTCYVDCQPLSEISRSFSVLLPFHHK